MISKLDELFPRCPNENTLSMLIYDGLTRFRDRVWMADEFGIITYGQADLLASEVAEFLKEVSRSARKLIQIREGYPTTRSIVILAAVKAGFVLIDQPNIDGNSLLPTENELSHFVFDNGFFKVGHDDISFRRAVAIGSNALIFGVSTATKDDTAFYAFPSSKLNGSGTPVPVLHSRAVKQIFCATKTEELHPYLRVIYNWFNGFRMPSY
jgi:hypothetical protein